MTPLASAKKDALYDCVALGEIMLRFDPGETRIGEAGSFSVWEGGAEYNMVRGLSSCFGKRTAVVTALVDNDLGRLVLNRIRAGGVDPALIQWVTGDGIGESVRNGLYFLDRGAGIRPASAVMDRGRSAASLMRPEDVDWDRLFGTMGVRWFHTGGIMAGLSLLGPEVILAAMKSARSHGTIISYDLNYRASLWQRYGGKAKADEVNRRILPYVDVLFGIEELERPPVGLETDLFKKAIDRMASNFPNLKMIVSTMRFVKSASVNDWSGLLWRDGQFYEGMRLENLDIFDRVGGGDSFAAGVIAALLEGMNPDTAINYGIAHGALAMTTPGDNSMATRAEVERFIQNRDASVQR